MRRAAGVHHGNKQWLKTQLSSQKENSNVNSHIQYFINTFVPVLLCFNHKPQCIFSGLYVTDYHKVVYSCKESKSIHGF